MRRPVCGMPKADGTRCTVPTAGLPCGIHWKRGPRPRVPRVRPVAAPWFTAEPMLPEDVPGTRAERLNAALALLEEGWLPAAAAARIGVTYRTLRRWLVEGLPGEREPEKISQ